MYFHMLLLFVFDRGFCLCNDKENCVGYTSNSSNTCCVAGGVRWTNGRAATQLGGGAPRDGRAEPAAGRRAGRPQGTPGPRETAVFRGPLPQRYYSTFARRKQRGGLCCWNTPASSLAWKQMWNNGTLTIKKIVIMMITMYLYRHYISFIPSTWRTRITHLAVNWADFLLDVASRVQSSWELSSWGDFSLELAGVLTPIPTTLSDESVNQGLVCTSMHSILHTHKILTFMSGVWLSATKMKNTTSLLIHEDWIWLPLCLDKKNYHMGNKSHKKMWTPETELGTQM